MGWRVAHENKSREQKLKLDSPDEKVISLDVLKMVETHLKRIENIGMCLQ